MSAPSAAHSLQTPRAVAAILWGGAIAGAFDLTYATLFYSFRGVKPIRVSQSIASGLLGPKAYDGGIPTAILGVALHFVIAIGAATVFYLLSRKLTFLVRQPLLWGPVFGAGIYFFMHYVVLPLAQIRDFGQQRFRSQPFPTSRSHDPDWAVDRAGCAAIFDQLKKRARGLAIRQDYLRNGM